MRPSRRRRSRSRSTRASWAPSCTVRPRLGPPWPSPWACLLAPWGSRRRSSTPWPFAFSTSSTTTSTARGPPLPARRCAHVRHV
eukprot:2926583-Prymnesium_polylepis.1